MNDIYKINDLVLTCNCSQITERQHDKLYEGSKKADGKKIRNLIKKHLPKLYNELALHLHNPFEKQCVRTKTHFIYLHSATDYFLKFTQ